MLEILVVPIFLAVLFIIAAVVLFLVFKRLLVNTVLGVIALLLIDFFGQELGFKVAINIYSVLISAIFGLAGVGALIILKLLGIQIL